MRPNVTKGRGDFFFPSSLRTGEVSEDFKENPRRNRGGIGGGECFRAPCRVLCSEKHGTLLPWGKS